MANLIFLSVDGVKDSIFKKQLEKVKGLTLLEATKFEQVQNYLDTSGIHLIVIYFTGTIDGKVALSPKTYEWAKQANVFVCGAVVDTKLFEEASQSPNIRIYETTIGLANLVGLIGRLLKNEKIGQPKHKRFSTDEEMLISVFGKNLSGKGRMKNLSKGGASVVISDPSLKLEKSDLLRVTIPLDKAGKTHNVSAEVVWVKEVQQTPIIRAYGLAFLDPEKWYDKVLAKSN